MIYQNNFANFTEITYKGRNVRDFVLKRVKNIAEYLIQNRENDTKSLSAVCKILHILVFQHGIDRVGLFSLSFPCVSMIAVRMGTLRRKSVEILLYFALSKWILLWVIVPNVTTIVTCSESSKMWSKVCSCTNIWVFYKLLWAFTVRFLQIECEYNRLFVRTDSNADLNSFTHL